MPQEPPVTPWARQHFGDDAFTVRQKLANALGQAQSRAVMVQQWSGLDTKEPYGGMWPKTYQEIETQLGDLPTAQRFKPPRVHYNLMVINGRLLLPFRHADNLGVPIKEARLKTKVAQELSVMLAAAPAAADLFSLFEQGGDIGETPILMRPELINLDPRTKIIFVPYVSHAHAGLIKAWWGEARMDERGFLTWGPDPEELPPAQMLPASGTNSDATGPLTFGGPGGKRFDEGELPPLGFPDVREKEA